MWTAPSCAELTRQLRQQLAMPHRVDLTAQHAARAEHDQLGQFLPQPLACPMDGLFELRLGGSALTRGLGERLLARLLDDLASPLMRLLQDFAGLRPSLTEHRLRLGLALLKRLLASLGGSQTLRDPLLPLLDGVHQRRPDELPGEPDQDREEDQLTEEGGVDAHVRDSRGRLPRAGIRPIASAALQGAEQRVGEGEEQRDRKTDDEGRVDQAGEQEHASGEHRDELGLTRGALQELRTHHADADAGAECAEPDDDADGERRAALDSGDQGEIHVGILVRSFWGRASMMLGDHGEIDHGENHEDEGLEGDHQDVEDRPSGTGEHRTEKGEQPARFGAETVEREQIAPGHRQQRDEDEDELARVHVAEQSHRQAHRLGEVLDEIEREIRRSEEELDEGRMRVKRRREQLHAETGSTLGLDREGEHQKQHRARHRQRDVEIGGRHGPKVFGTESVRDHRHQIERQELEGVHQEHPHEDGQRQRCHEAAVAVEDVL